MTTMYDRFSSKEDARPWLEEQFMQGFGARTNGLPLDGPNTPRPEVVGDYAYKSWRAGWCDADAGITSATGSAS